MAAGGVGYFATGYWHLDYWHVGYWYGETVVAGGGGGGGAKVGGSRRRSWTPGPRYHDLPAQRFSPSAVVDANPVEGTVLVTIRCSVSVTATIDRDVMPDQPRTVRFRAAPVLLRRPRAHHGSVAIVLRMEPMRFRAEIIEPRVVAFSEIDTDETDALIALGEEALIQ